MKRIIIAIFALAVLGGTITASAMSDDQTKKEQAKRDTEDMKKGKVPRTMGRTIYGLDKKVAKEVEKQNPKNNSGSSSSGSNSGSSSSNSSSSTTKK